MSSPLALQHKHSLVEYLEHLCLTLVNLPKLKDLDLTGNEITLHEYYKYYVLRFGTSVVYQFVGNVVILCSVPLIYIKTTDKIKILT